MQKDFHYYATYCASIIAGFTHEESMKICYSAQYVDYCSKTVLKRIGAPLSAATTQLNLEMMNVRTDILGLQDITRIWSSFHFLPYDLYADVKGISKTYKNKYRLICKPNGNLVVDTVNLAKDKSLQSIGVAMHVLCDTWAHSGFAGTPSLVINNTTDYFYELLPKEDGTYEEKKITFHHSTTEKDNLDSCIYINSLYQMSENAIMNLGHGRAGHLPDYSFIKYKYLPAWNDYDVRIKDNPSDYYCAFCQMVYALRYLKGNYETFEKDKYDYEVVSKYENKIKEILNKRQIDACPDWLEFAQELSGKEIKDFYIDEYESEYVNAKDDEKDETFLGKFILAALSQKSMITNRVYSSGNLLCGYSIEYNEGGISGIKDYLKLVKFANKGGKK